MSHSGGLYTIRIWPDEDERGGNVVLNTDIRLDNLLMMDLWGSTSLCIQEVSQCKLRFSFGQKDLRAIAGSSSHQYRTYAGQDCDLQNKGAALTCKSATSPFGRSLNRSCSTAAMCVRSNW